MSTHGAFDCAVRLQVEVPAFGHGDASVDQGAVYRVTQCAFSVLCVCVFDIGRVESGMVALADDDDGYLGWWLRGMRAIEVLALLLERFQLEV